MWHYTEGVHNWDPIWAAARHPDPARAVVAVVRRHAAAGCPRRTSPASTPSARCGHLRATGHDHSWFVLTQKIIEKEFALSGSEQNPDLTGKNVREVLDRVRPGAPAPGRGVQEQRRGLRRRRHARRARRGDERGSTGEPLIDLGRPGAPDRRPRPRDRQPVHQGPAGHRDPRGPPLPRRQADPHRGAAQDPRPAGRPADRRPAEHPHPQDARRAADRPVRPRAARRRHAAARALYAAGEVAGFGGGGVHGYRSLEGTFLGGCLFSGRQAGRSVALAVSS